MGAGDPKLKPAWILAEMPFVPLTKHLTYRQGGVELAECRRAAPNENPIAIDRVKGACLTSCQTIDYRNE
jgi:hypothetical protein